MNEDLHIPTKYDRTQPETVIRRAADRAVYRYGGFNEEAFIAALVEIQKQWGNDDRMNWLEIERWATRATGSTAGTIFDALVDPAITASVPAQHIYINFTELIAGEASNPAHALGFNIGVVPRATAAINEPGTISFSGWSHVNIASIAPAATEGVVVGHAPFWNMPIVNMASNQIISMSGIHVPSGSGTGFFGSAGSNIVILNECWIGSGINCSPGSLYATDSYIASQKITSGSTSDNVILHGCTWIGAVNLGGINEFHMMDGYLNGSLTTTGHITGGFVLEAAIQGTVQINHVEGGVVQNLGSQNGTFFQIGSAVTGKCLVTGAWSQIWLAGKQIRADVHLDLVGANPGLQLVGVTDSLITATFAPLSTGAQAYTIDAASARNLIVASGLHNTLFTVASTNVGSTCLVVDELFASGALATATDAWRRDMVPGELFSPQTGVNTIPAPTGSGGAPSGPATGSLSGTYPAPTFAGRDSSVDAINKDLLPAALLDAVGVSVVTSYPASVGGVTVGDADYTATPFDRHIQFGTALTATRTVTLPFPNTVPKGTPITVSDFAAITGGFGIKIVTGAFSSIKGTTSTRTINQKQGWMTLESDGNVTWNIVGFSDVLEVDMNQAFLLMGG